MYAIGLRHPRDADGAARVNGVCSPGADTGTPGRTGCVRPDGFSHGSGARTGAHVAVPGSRVGDDPGA